MDSERWKRIDSLYQDAIARPPEERDAFLRSACDGDEELSREVKSLLRAQQRAGSFLDTPAMEVAARNLASEDLASEWKDDGSERLGFASGETDLTGTFCTSS